VYTTLKRVLVGPPVSLRDEEGQKLGKPTALAVFSSDAISSTSYATDQILAVLLPAGGVLAFNYLVPISLVVLGLLVIVVMSYRQTIYAYPTGGGSYVVSRENLGQRAGLVAGASLMVDYVLTVSVSVSSGVAALIAAIPELDRYRVPICLLMIGLMTLGNLRGLKASGRAFAGPTYAYIVMLAVLLAVGAYRTLTGGLEPLPDAQREALLAQEGFAAATLTGVTFLVVLRAFSSGAVALTGVEAISNGVPAFRKPRSRNAATTLVIMAAILGIGFFGVSALAAHLKPVPDATNTVLSSMAEQAFGGRNVLFFLLQAATLAILTLAANTSFADFPRVASIMARDRFLPKQLSDRGDRLVYSNGIILLAGVAAVLIVAFGGDTDRLVPLYAVGVFCAFTLSQSGMVRHHLRLRERGWRPGLAINALGAVTTLVVLCVVGVSKFTEGAWIPLVVIPLLVWLFTRIHRHYERVGDELEIPAGYRPHRHPNTVVVLFERLHVGVLEAYEYGTSLGDDVVPVAVVTEPDEGDELVRAWKQLPLPGEPRVLLSPTADLAGALLPLLDELQADDSRMLVTVVLPEYTLHHWYEQTLHNQNVVTLRARLRLRPRTIIAAVPISVPRRRAHTTVAAAEAADLGEDLPPPPG
jgi:amino acid transporter